MKLTGSYNLVLSSKLTRIIAGALLDASLFFDSLKIEKPLVSQMITKTLDQLFSIRLSETPFKLMVFHLLKG